MVMELDIMPNKTLVIALILVQTPIKSVNGKIFKKSI